jgi:protein TonB
LAAPVELVEVTVPPETAPEQARPEPAFHVRSLNRPGLRAKELPPPAQTRTATEPEAEPGAPLDLTGEVALAATSTAHGTLGSQNGVDGAPGGKASSRGSGDGSSNLPGSAPDRSSKISLPDQTWSCPWPRQADAEQIDEQVVVIRVVVSARGVVESAWLVSDPGHGFGEAALACAKKTRFTPARDRSGESLRATSPPIRVRFSR